MQPGQERLDLSAPHGERAIAGELHLRESLDDQWGHSESLDPDNVGDIADEGPGHRG